METKQMTKEEELNKTIESTGLMADELVTDHGFAKIICPHCGNVNKASILSFDEGSLFDTLCDEQKTLCVKCGEKIAFHVKARFEVALETAEK